ncbi:small cardioactive peptides-like isoform X2 [Physella acuta]|uniref:small cardioactive peptides-like isoform X2 n=1 Tax=Physella acuta TaxID=109671 RepID=UPI0027DC04C6|nr:small cardioactive peptides-like isoform X2 [Physella acuta]
MEISLSKVSMSLALLIVIVYSVTGDQGSENVARRATYLALPRMGRSEVQKKPQLPWNFIVPRKRGLPQGFILPRKRGYLAFPRMGRSHFKSETVDDISNCCGIGLKNEFFVGQDGREELQSVCPPRAECCEGLREIIDAKPDGVYYSMCVPTCPLSQDSNARSSEVRNKLLSVLKK